jgi:hypothetical protein
MYQNFFLKQKKEKKRKYSFMLPQRNTFPPFPLPILKRRIMRNIEKENGLPTLS